MRLAAIVLAAGSAGRFGGDKLSVDFLGQPLVWHAIRAARAAPVERVIVVCSPALLLPDWEGEPVVEALRITSDALSTSLKAGIAAVAWADGAFVFLGDMPLVPEGIANKLARQLGANFAAVPRYQGRPGHPVLFARRAFAELALLEGDAGAGRLLKRHVDIAWLEVDDPGILLDVDRAEDLARLRDRAEGRNC
ncbi:MAG: nucleotidyltransferase family protein [Novosphingobium sp.]